MQPPGASETREKQGHAFPPPSAWIPSRASRSGTRPSQRPANVSSPPGNRPVTPFLQSTRPHARMERKGGLRKMEAASCAEHNRKQGKVNLRWDGIRQLPPQLELLSAGFGSLLTARRRAASLPSSLPLPNPPRLIPAPPTGGSQEPGPPSSRHCCLLFGSVLSLTTLLRAEPKGWQTMAPGVKSSRVCECFARTWPQAFTVAFSSCNRDFPAHKA